MAEVEHHSGGYEHVRQCAAMCVSRPPERLIPLYANRLVKRFQSARYLAREHRRIDDAASFDLGDSLMN